MSRTEEQRESERERRAYETWQEKRGRGAVGVSREIAQLCV